MGSGSHLAVVPVLLGPLQVLLAILPALLVAVVVTTVSMVSGVYASFWLDSAPAPTIILLLAAAFILAFLYRQFVNARQGARVP